MKYKLTMVHNDNIDNIDRYWLSFQVNHSEV
jgi:hypothetical protein